MMIELVKTYVTQIAKVTSESKSDKTPIYGVVTTSLY